MLSTHSDDGTVLLVLYVQVCTSAYVPGTFFIQHTTLIDKMNATT